MKLPLLGLLVTLTILQTYTLHALTPTPPLTQVSIQFRVYALRDDVPSLSFGRNQRVEFIEAGLRSSIYSYTGPEELIFTLGSVPTSKEPLPAASVRIPLDAKQVTLLTTKLGKGRYGMYAIPDDPQGVPPKHARVHNLSTQSLLIGYNNRSTELRPGSSVLIEGAGKGQVIQIAYNNRGRWQKLPARVIEFTREDLGTNVVLIPKSGGNGVSMFTMTGWPNPKSTLPSQPTS